MVQYFTKKYGVYLSMSHKKQAKKYICNKSTVKILLDRKRIN